MKAPAHSPLDTYVPPEVRGAGVFLASADTLRVGGLKGRAETALLVGASIRWAAVWVESFDGRRASPAAVQRAVEALRAAGLGVALWSFPAPATAARAGRYLGSLARAHRVPLAILDVEDPDGRRGPMDWEPADARALVDATIDSIDEHTMIGVTSYPGRAGHGLPWGELVVGVGMPQVYGTADDRARARRAVESWAAAHGAVVPITSLRSPGAQDADVSPEQLERRLDAIAIEGVSAVGLWSWALLRSSTMHRAAVRSWAASRGW